MKISKPNPITEEEIIRYFARLAREGTANKGWIRLEKLLNNDS